MQVEYTVEQDYLLRLKGSQKTILIVDDEHVNIRLIESMLEKKGYFTIKATNGRECLETIGSIKPDLILLDIYMPEMSGIMVCKTLKANEENKDIPVIFVTANTDNEILLEAFKSGCSDYVRKPINEAELLVRVRHVLRIKEYQDEITKLNKKLKELSLTDELTGLRNYRYFKDYIDRKWAEYQRFKDPLAIIMADIDHFKLINDTYGHLAGDEVLKTIGHVLEENTRPYDLVSRYGGEEFMAVLTNSSKEESLEIAERFRKMVESTETVYDGKRIHCTISLGIALLGTDTEKDMNDTSTLISIADKALYQAKMQGRNQTVLITSYD